MKSDLKKVILLIFDESRSLDIIIKAVLKAGYPRNLIQIFELDLKGQCTCT